MTTPADYRAMPQTSAALGLAHCNGCGACCRLAPCVLLPTDVARIEAHLGRPIREDIRVERRPSGEWLVRMKPPCVFLDGDRCSIHEVKPTGARDFECWTPATFAATYFWSASQLKRVLGFRKAGK